MTNKQKYVLFASLALLAGVGYYFYKQGKKAYDFCFKIKGFKINSLTKSFVSFGVIINFQNKSKLEFTITKQEFDVYVNGLLVTKINSSQTSVLKPESWSPIATTITFNPDEVFKGLKSVEFITNMLTGTDKINIKFAGKVTAKSGIISATIPVDLSYTIKELMTPSTAPSTC